MPHKTLFYRDMARRDLQTSKAEITGLPFGVSNAEFAALAATLLGYIKTTQDTEDRHSVAVHETISLLLACEKGVSGISEFRGRIEETEKNKDRKSKKYPAACNFDEGLRYIVPTKRTKKERLKIYAEYTAYRLSNAYREPEAYRLGGKFVRDTSYGIPQEMKDGFNNATLLQRINDFSQWHKSKRTKANKESGKKGGRPRKNSKNNAS